MAIQRARQVLVTAAVGTVVIVAIEFPFRQLSSQRHAIAATAAELRAVDAQNASLRSSIRSLHSSTTIGAIAHRYYGLVEPGQRSYVILPAARSGAGTKLNIPPLSGIDLGAASQSGLRMATRPIAHAGATSLWSRFVDRLEFWR